MGFNSAFKGLSCYTSGYVVTLCGQCGWKHLETERQFIRQYYILWCCCNSTGASAVKAL